METALALDAMREIPSSVQIISGHFLWKSIFPRIPRENMLTLLRDPVTRVISQYLNWKDNSRIEWSSPSWNIDDTAKAAFQVAQDGNLEAFLESDNPLIIANTRNVFVRAFCGVDEVDPHDNNPKLVDYAFENIRHFFWIGLVERMETSMLTLARQIGKAGLMDGALQVHNAAQERVVVTKRARGLLRECTKLDRRLYKLVEQEFEDRARTILREGIWSALSIESPQQTTNYSQCLGFSDLDFFSGWSFEEKTADEVQYRWSFGNTEATILLPKLLPGEHIIELEILAIAEGLKPSQIRVLLDNIEPHMMEHIEKNSNILLRYHFPETKYNPSRSLIKISVIDGQLKNHTSDPRSNLGVALAAAKIFTKYT